MGRRHGIARGTMAHAIRNLDIVVPSDPIE